MDAVFGGASTAKNGRLCLIRHSLRAGLAARTRNRGGSDEVHWPLRIWNGGPSKRRSDMKSLLRPRSAHRWPAVPGDSDEPASAWAARTGSTTPRRGRSGRYACGAPARPSSDRPCRPRRRSPPTAKAIRSFAKRLRGLAPTLLQGSGCPKILRSA